MKVNANLGVASKKELLDHRACFQVGAKVRMLQDSLAFSKFMFTNFGNKPFSEKDLHIISAGIKGAANVARLLSTSVEGQGNQEQAKKLAVSAEGLNNKVRELLGPPKDGSKHRGVPMEEGVKIDAGLKKLDKKVQELSENIEKLCYVESKPKLSGALPYTRAQMGLTKPVAPASAPSLAPADTELKKHVYPAFSRPALHKTIKSFRRIP